MHNLTTSEDITKLTTKAYELHVLFFFQSLRFHNSQMKSQKGMESEMNLDKHIPVNLQDLNTWRSPFFILSSGGDFCAAFLNDNIEWMHIFLIYIC